MEKMAMDIAIIGCELRYDDASLVDHLFALAADVAAKAPEAMRQSVLDELEAQKAAHGEAPLFADALDQVIAFLRAPKSIRVRLKPPSPVTIGELARLGEPQPNELMELLGVSVDRP
jgi:hypothetical protein